MPFLGQKIKSLAQLYRKDKPLFHMKVCNKAEVSKNVGLVFGFFGVNNHIASVLHVQHGKIVF